MANVLTFLRTEGSLILMGMLLLWGIITQIQSARRFRKLKKDMASIAIRPAQTDSDSRGEIRELTGLPAGQRDGAQAEPKRAMRGVRYQQEQEEDILDEQEEAPVSARRSSVRSGDGRTGNAKPVPVRQAASKRLASEEPEEDTVDSGLLQLKQSLDRIAVSRDQKVEEQPHKGRILTTAEQKVIADILSEYLA